MRGWGASTSTSTKVRLSVILRNKVAVVTGAGRGLGRAYALALSDAGSAVVVNDLDGDVAGAVVAEITGRGGTAIAVPGSAADSGVAERAVLEAVEHFGRLDIVVPNAGVLRDRTLAKLTDEDFDVVIGTHLSGTFNFVRAAVARFIAQGEGGRVIVVGSPAGQRASFGQTPYSAAKAGIVGMARTWAAELSRHRITVNAIVPIALTRMVATIPGLGELVEAVDRGEPIPPHVRRSGMGAPADVAPVVVFLASDQAGGITGQAIGAGGDKISLWAPPTEVIVAVQDGGWSVEDLHDAFQTTFGSSLQPFLGPPPPDVARVTGAGSR
jgi:NAD(P)-dependent dehydrogenase (short-subunit alcohol dehydrogenase family)